MSRRAARGLLILVIAVVGYETIGVHTQSTPAPILIVTNGSASNPFDAYLPEILQAEGLNQFAVKDVAAVQATDLSNATVVVLAETALTAGQANLFSNYVAGGGRLVAMKPDNQLAPVLGLTPVGSTTTEGYFAINTAVSFADGFPTATLPFHGQAVNYTVVNGATALATVFTDATTATTFPAVVKFGRTVTWSYDVARSIVYTRQGNPANASDRDGQPPFRTEDIFYNAIDKDKVNIPYADVQMRMLGRAISDLMADAMPLPRLWYFPNGNHSLMVITSDSHANPQSYFDAVVASVESRGARDSFYMFNGGPSLSSTANWISRGHEFGMHPAAFQNGWTLAQAYQNNLDWFQQNGYAPPSPTIRNHQIEWQGWVDAAKLEATYGIGLDLTYYTWGPAVTYPDGHQAHGYITGSGLPMRFIDQTGAIVPVYQQVTSVIDEQLLVSSFSENLTTDQALAVTRQLIDDSQAGGYSAIATQFHVDYYQFGQVQPWAEGTMDYANSLSIPMWTAQRWLNYTSARAATTMSGFAWDPAGRQLAFTVNVPTGSEAQSLALPGMFGGFSLSSVLVDGGPAIAAPDTISGRSTKFVNVSSGPHTIAASYGTTTPPTDHAPIANPDTASVTNGHTVAINVLANDTDADGDTLKVDSTSPDSGAAITINADQTISYTPNAGTCGTDTFTYTIDDGRGGTASGTVTVNITCSNGQVVHSTFADFAQSCAVPASAIVTRVGDGEVRLAGVQGDEYTGATLDTSQWIAGTWSGGAYTPVPSGGILSLSNATGAYVRSISTFALSSLESSVRFSALPWEHVGWGSLDFSAGYAMFSTYNTSTSLFARTADTSGTETQTNLGPIPQGFHNYRIDRQAISSASDQISYYIDGVLSAQHTVATLPEMYVYQSENGGTTPTLDIDRIWVYPPYTSSGTYQSCTMDMGQTTSAWSTANWSATAPSGTTFDLRTRTSTDASTWSAWSAPLTTAGSAITSPAGRYLQYLAEFSSTDPNQSPVLDSVAMQYSDGGGPTLPSLSINDVSVTEGNSGTVNATFTVTLSPASSQNVTVNYATAPGTATSGVDFTATSGTLTFAAGATSKSIAVPVIGDTVSEPNETFVVNLSNATNATISRAQGIGTIVDDDTSVPVPTLSINDVSITEGNSGTSNATFTVSLSAASTQTVTVNYATASGTATSGSDFTAVSGTLTFAAGTMTQPIQVPIVGDTRPEPNETFTVNLTGAVGATIARATGTGTIVDNDAGTIKVTAPNTAVTWLVGTAHSITWTNNLGTGATVKLEVSRDGGNTWSLITSSVANSSSTGGSFTWTVSGPATTTARVRATWTVNSAVTDTSDVNFTIANPSITVNSPNGGGTWTVGSTVSVTWSSNLPSTENVKIELSTNGGASYSTVLKSSSPNDGSQSFTVQSAWRSTQAKIRVSWVANTSVNDTSNANFTIR
jgi:Big-like domain-containing protein/Calx-beta domain-containing protein